MAVLRAIAYIAGTPEPPMPPRDTLGPFEHLVLSVIVSLPNRAYAVPIREALERVGGRPVARGALYTTLARLEAKGLLDSRLGDPEPVRGGRPKRFYHLTTAGAAALTATQIALEDSVRRVAHILGGGR
jgi:DNA-binding PadR family transcriptional regulator